MCGWKKRQGDKALPSLRDDVLKRWEETKGRPSPELSPDAESDEEESESEEEDTPPRSQSRGVEWGSDDEEEPDELEEESEE